jgi:hypothetical protein
MSKKLYFCNCCRKKIDQIEDLLFVEESKRGFCSEDCIVDFFTPYMKSFDREEVSMREAIGIEPGEIDVDLFQDRGYFEDTLYSSAEVWLEKNELQEEFYTHINPIVDGLFYVLICTYYEGEPSFVFFKTITRSSDLIQYYRRGKPVTNDCNIEDNESDVLSEKSSLDEVSLPAEVVEDIDLKKSEYLADLLERKKETDIPFEEYPLYDDYITLTLDEPDDEYHSEDQAGDKIFTFIKSFQKSGKSFFYIVICLSVDIPDSTNSALMPVITFPSIDDELYKFYAVGDKKSSRLTN